MTEPTDAELLAEWDRVSHIAGAGQRRLACLRAVLAKWGTPPAVAGEPYGYLFTAQEATIVGDERKSMREVFTRKKPPCASVALYTTPPPTKAQAGAVPLTDEQAASLCKMGPVYAPDGRVVRTPEQYRRELEGAKLAGIRTAERAHGIKGGQHGTS